MLALSKPPNPVNAVSMAVVAFALPFGAGGASGFALFSGVVASTVPPPGGAEAARALGLAIPCAFLAAATTFFL